MSITVFKKKIVVESHNGIFKKPVVHSFIRQCLRKKTVVKMCPFFSLFIHKYLLFNVINDLIHVIGIMLLVGCNY